MELFVQSQSICTHSYYEPVEYGDWADEFDFTVHGVSATSRGEWSGLAYPEERFNVAFTAEPGADVYVLWMTYGTGDSFGHGSGYGEIVWVFKSLEVAEAARKQIDLNRDQFSLEFFDDASNMIEYSNPGAGYFENIERLEIDKFKLNF